MWNAAIAQEGAIVSSLLGRSQKTETCRKEEKEKKIGVHLTTLGWGDNGRHHPFRGH